MKSIDEHIQKDQSEIASAKEEGNLPKVRHLTEELKELEGYKDHHPEDKHDPNALELFCDANPDEPECLVYDDWFLILKNVKNKRGFNCPFPF